MVDDCYAQIDPKEKGEEYTEVYCDMHAMGDAGLTLLRKLQFWFQYYYQIYVKESFMKSDCEKAPLLGYAFQGKYMQRKWVYLTKETLLLEKSALLKPGLCITALISL